MTAVKQLLTRPEAAHYLALSVRMIDELLKAGELPAVYIGRSVRFRPAALDGFIEARERNGGRRKKGATR